MQLRELATDDDAVSPVIGVILMVAITVILAAVIGAFVLGFGGGGPSAPSATWDATDNSSGHVIFQHDGGDSIENPEEILDITGGEGAGADDLSASSDPLTTGEQVSENVTADGDSVGGEYLLVWEQDGSSQDLSTYSA